MRATFAFVLWVGILGAAGQAMAAQPPGLHRIDSTATFTDITASVLALKDPGGAMGVEEAARELKRLGDAAAAQNPKLRILDPADQALWLKFDLQLEAGAPSDRVLLVERPVLDRVTLYTGTPDGGWTAHPEVGAELPFSRRPIPHPSFAFPIRLEPGQVLPVMLRVWDPGAGVVTVSVWEPVALARQESSNFGLYCLYFGLVAGMLLYNLLLYVVTRDVGFLLYVGQIACIAIGTAGSSGYGAMYAWGDSVFLNQRSGSAYAFLFIFVAFLTRQFLSSPVRMPRVDKWLLAVAALGLFSAVLALLGFAKLTFAILVPGAVVTAVFITALSAVAAYRRWPGAAYFCAAWVSLYVSIVVGIALRIKPDLAPTLTPTYMLVVGSAIEMVLLSLALADRINEERRQKERAQSQTLAILRVSEALGRETRLDDLYRRLCETMAELTGATSLAFVLRDEDLDEWFLYDSWDASQRIPVRVAGENGLLPLTVFEHVRSREERLVLADAVSVDPFAADPAWRGLSACSVLAMPVVRHGEISAIMILQHGGRAGVFSTVAADAVAAIAGPLAVALANVLIYERLEQRVAEQTRELRDTQQKLLATARLAGRAEVATNVLHNVGNTLNSVNVSAELIRAELAASRSRRVAATADLLDQNAGDLANFLERDAKGRMLPRYLRELAGALADEHARMQENLSRLLTSVDHIKNVLSAQQALAGRSAFSEIVRPSEIADGALRLLADDLKAARVQVVTAFEDVAPLRLDTTRTMEILINLVSNAWQAMEDTHDRPRVLTLAVSEAGGRVRFQVSDTGCGIRREDHPWLFAHGFTTRVGGHGFGLHSAALAASEMGGQLNAHSDGPGRGATFTLEVPVVRT